MADMILLRSTYASPEDAQAAATRLIERCVAACVHIQAIWSTYRWKGKIETKKEWLLEARTIPAARQGCWAALLEEHPYEKPLVEIVAQTQVPTQYGDWAKGCVRADGP